MTPTADTIHILHVDDEPDFSDMAATFLEREDDRIQVQTATNPDDGLEILTKHDVDCIVSDYDMPCRNGIEFLKTVREEYPDLPFVLYTGKGSEAVASEAISAGVTDYLQKGTGTDQYTVLANRIANSVDRYQAEQAQQRNRVLVEEATDAILIVGADATIHYATPSAESVLGRSPAELVGTNGFDPIHPDDQAHVMEEFAALVEQPRRRRTVEFRYQRPDGSWIWAEARGRNLLDTATIDGIVIYTRDITEHKDRERELERERDRFRAVFEEAFDAMVLADDEGQFVEANPSATGLFGLSKDGLVGRSIEEFAPEDFDFVTAWEDFQQSDDERGTFPLVRPDGTERTVEYAATANIIPGRHLSILRDVTERERREQELRRQTGELEAVTTRLEAQYRTLFEEAPVMAVVTRTAEGRPIIEDCNEQFLDTLRYKKEAVVGTGLAEMYPTDSEERLLEGGGNKRSLENGVTKERRELVTADGEVVETVLRAVPRRDPSGEVVGTLAMYVDITEREE